jgi:hypothetical protein
MAADAAARPGTPVLVIHVVLAGLVRPQGEQAAESVPRGGSLGLAGVTRAGGERGHRAPLCGWPRPACAGGGGVVLERNTQLR